MFTDFIDAPPAGACADWTIPQRWDRFGREEHRVWATLFERQCRRLSGRSVAAFARGIGTLGLASDTIPRFDDLNERLYARTGWTVVAVPGLLPDEIFFGHLARRRFPAGNFIRPASSLDYLEEPDVFHDVFGHVPLLAEPWFADLVQRLGEEGLAAAASGRGEAFSRLYWFTIEFGLALEDGELRIYGAGLASSFGEAGHALESDVPERRRFDLESVLRTPYRSDVFQPLYYVLDDFESLPAATDLARLEARLLRL
jgi:phenylalanine-4-hydroxylase